MDYPARIVTTGPFHEEDIIMVCEPMPLLPEWAEAKIAELWEVEQQLNPNFYSSPGTLLVASGLGVREGKIRVYNDLSEYKYFMATTHESIAPNLPDNHLHRAIGFLAITITADGCVMLGVRSSKIDWPTLRHVVPAGRLTPQQAHPYQGVRDEFKSELGLEPHDISSLECIGVVADMTWRRLNYEFVFLALTFLSFRQVMDRARNARSGSEHVQLEPFPWKPDFMWELLLSDPDGFVPTGFAGLALCYDVDLSDRDFKAPDWTPAHRTYPKHMGRRL